MTARFLHTADWQLGKPFESIADDSKRILVQQERVRVLERVAAAAAEHQAQFVLVAGDLFDSWSADNATVAAACSAIGAMRVPVLVIPGNHDHGGPGTIWEKDFFRREQLRLAPNLRVLLKREPVELEHAVILPCPLLRRADPVDPTAWLRASGPGPGGHGPKPRIVLAHGTIQGFGSSADPDSSDSVAANLLRLDALADGDFDYIALGDWHGMKRVGDKAWYSGTPEIDRFPRGESNEPGHCLAVTTARGGNPDVQPVRTGRFSWHQLAFAFADDGAVGRLESDLARLTGNRAGQDLLHLELSGSLGIGAFRELEAVLTSFKARLLRLKLSNRTVLAPSEAEIQALTQRAADPLIASVARRLIGQMNAGTPDAEDARIALRELHAACLTA